MKVLVLSDSHSSYSFMRRAIAAVKPDAVVHLGDHYDDGTAMAEEFPNIIFHQVPGNCDRSRMLQPEPEVRCYDVGGVRLFMTHGHLQSVKTTLYRLVYEARSMNAKAALYGHTHVADCHQEDGLWVINPGSAGYGRKTGAVIETANGEIVSCRIIDEYDLEV